MLHHKFVVYISKFKTRMELQFQQQSRMEEGNFFDLYFGNSDSDSEFENIVPL